MLQKAQELQRNRTPLTAEGLGGISEGDDMPGNPSYLEQIKKHSLSELVDIEDHIDRQKYPDRYALVVAEIKHRRSALSSRDAASLSDRESFPENRTASGKQGGTRAVDVAALGGITLVAYCVRRYVRAIVALPGAIVFFFCHEAGHTGLGVVLGIPMIFGCCWLFNRLIDSFFTDEDEGQQGMCRPPNPGAERTDDD